MNNKTKIEEITHEELTKLKYAYTAQKTKYQKRGVSFNISFDSWLNWWIDTGRLDQRGRGQNDFVMARIDPKKGYDIDNIVCRTKKENGEVSEKVITTRTGKNNSRFKGVIHTPFGDFESLQQCADSTGVKKPTIAKRVNNENNKEWYRSE